MPHWHRRAKLVLPWCPEVYQLLQKGETTHLNQCY